MLGALSERVVAVGDPGPVPVVNCAGAEEAAAVDACVLQVTPDSVGDVRQRGIITVIEHGHEESAVHGGEPIPDGTGDLADHRVVSFDDARTDVCNADGGSGVRPHLPCMEPDELDHVGMAERGGDCFVQRVTIDVATGVLDRLANRSAGVSGIERIQAGAGASLDWACFPR